jgi:hypothetical protein
MLKRSLQSHISHLKEKELYDEALAGAMCDWASLVGKVQIISAMCKLTNSNNFTFEMS